MNPLYAQIDPDLIKITAGQIAATMLSLTALAGGMMMIAVWALRWHFGQPILPQAVRQPLHVPLLLTVAGVVWAVLMAVAVLAVEIAPPGDATVGQAATVPAGEKQPGSEPPSGDTAQSPADDADQDPSGGDTPMSGDEAASGDEPVPGEESTAAGDEAVGLPAEDESASDSDLAANGGATVVSDSTEADGAVTGDSPNSGKSVQQRLNEIGRMMAMNLAFQLATLAAFGILIYVVQQGRQRGISGPGVSSGDETLMAIQAPTPVTSSPNLWPDLDEPAVTVSAPVAVPGADLPRASAANFPLPQSVDALNDGTAADELRDESSAPVVTFERWHFPTELRWAFEVFLVALLPTFILRLVLVWVLDDPAQHPLLELMTEGVPWSIMAMIAVMAVVVAPLAEELQYRVIVLGGLAQTGTVLTGWIVSSLLFAFAHNFPDSIALLPLAFAIGYAYIRRRSYRTVALIHFLFNGFNMLLAMLTLP